jgi:6-phosphogluconolactonase (cycloisomerase 2 family)
VYVTSYLIPGGSGGAVAVFARDQMTGVLTQLPGAAGCVSQAGYDGCTPAIALTQPIGVLVSGDGKNVYVASPSFGAIAAFARDPATGALTQLSGKAACVTGSGDGGACEVANVAGVFGLGMSPNGRNLYAAALGMWNGGISVFSRNQATGALAQLAGIDGCISEDGNDGACAIGVGIHLPTSVDVTPDGRHVYVTASAGDSVAGFQRNAKTGALTQLPGTRACVSSDLVANPACVYAKRLDAAQAATVSPDGRNLYVASAFSDAIAIFKRNKKSGKITQLDGWGCIENESFGATAVCADGRALDGPNSVVLSPNGKHVYVGVASSSAVAAFKRW